MSEQNYSNHTKFVPAFHFFVLPVLVLNISWAVHRWKMSLWSVDGAISVLTSVALVIGFLFARLFALSVQDRVIRLEERLRCERLLPQDLQSRVAEFEPAQLVALRFASDAELPGLARKVLDEKLKDRKAIKRLIKAWRPDYLRALNTTEVWRRPQLKECCAPLRHPREQLPHLWRPTARWR